MTITIIDNIITFFHNQHKWLVTVLRGFFLNYKLFPEDMM